LSKFVNSTSVTRKANTWTTSHEKLMLKDWTNDMHIHSILPSNITVNSIIYILQFILKPMINDKSV